MEMHCKLILADMKWILQYMSVGLYVCLNAYDNLGENSTPVLLQIYTTTISVKRSPLYKCNDTLSTII